MFNLQDQQDIQLQTERDRLGTPNLAKLEAVRCVPEPLRLALNNTRKDLFRTRRVRNSSDFSDQQFYRRAHKQKTDNTYGLRLLRTKLLGPSSDGASSEDVLTMLLCNALDEAAARDLARHLLQTFGSLKSIFGASETLLNQHCDNNEDCVDLVLGYFLLMKTALREPFESQPVISSMPALYDYLLLTNTDKEVEVFRTLFLNSRNMLIKDEVIARGTVNHVPVYNREVLKRTLEVGAVAVLLVHNHPSGCDSPSQEDIHITNSLNRCLNDINVVLHDHIIIGRHTCQSMRNLGLITASQLTRVTGETEALAACRHTMALCTGVRKDRSTD